MRRCVGAASVAEFGDPTIRMTWSSWRNTRRTNYERIEGGHGGAANTAQAAFNMALMFEFLLRTPADAPA